METVRFDPFGLVGKVIGGKYRVEAVVEETGLSVVYRALHRIWKRPVAIKAFHAPQQLPADGRALLLESFVREGALLAELSEKTAAVCQARDVASLVTDRGEWVPYMVLEWMDGENLESALARERAEGTPPRTVELAIRILGPVARALSLAHDRGIVHRDVKPGNICLLRNPSPDTPPTKLYDFGIALSLREPVPAGVSSTARLESFTPGYAAPEQFTPECGAIGPWTDVYALALVFIELVTGQDAMTGDTVDELRARACDPHERPTPRNHGTRLGSAIERVLSRAVALRPEDRFAHAGDFWTALTLAAKDRFMEATAPIPLVRPRRSTRGGWVFPVVALASEAAAIAAMIYWNQVAHVLAMVHLH